MTLGVLGAITLVVLAGLLALWPYDGGPGRARTLVGPALAAQVDSVTRMPCALSPTAPCQVLAVTVEDGGKRVAARLTQPGTDVSPSFSGGDRIRVLRNFDPRRGGAPPDEGSGGVDGAQAYVFSDFERRRSLALLLILFVAVVLAFGRRMGAASLLGLAISLALVVKFIVPAILSGSEPVLVALVGALAIMLVTVALTHGVNAKSAAAILGSTAALLLTVALAALFVKLAQITGFSSEEARIVGSAATGAARLSLEGLVLAGMLIGALGVLDDVTVSQSSTVMALVKAKPSIPLRELYTTAMSVGRDHLGATVNTLVLAYVGASLPVLLIFGNQAISFGNAVNREYVAEEIVATLVGSIGLVAAVPLTTALAALLARRLPPGELAAAGEHTHVH